MGVDRVWATVVMLMLLKGRWSTNGCLEQERIALLQLKPFFNGSDSLRDWVDGEKSSDCCQWERVECNTSTGRVIHLYLNYTRDSTSGDQWYLNASLFLPFEKLEVLSLQYNYIAGWVEKEGFERLSSRLTNLKVLDLSWNSFNDSIFSSLSQFSSLKSLNLASNNFTVLIQKNGVERLQRLINLEVLDLSYNEFNNSILSFLGGLSSLKYLYINDNRLKGSVQIKDALCNLENLDMSGNEVEKLVVPRDNKGMSKLKVLYLERVNTNKSTLQSLGPFPSLKTLSLRENNFNGTMTTLGAVTLPRLINLEFLDLSFNQFDNSILSFLGGLSSLKYLYINDNRLKGSIQIKDALCNLENLDMSGNEVEKLVVPRDNKCMSKLKVLYLERVNTNKSTLQSLGPFPSLKTLSLRENNFNGTMTTLELHNLTNVEVLFLEFSSLQINFLQSLGALTSLKNLSLFNCEINGILTTQELPNFKNLEYLDMSFTTGNSSFLQIIGEMNSLKVLDLSSSRLNGTLPAQGLCELIYLQDLDVSYNDLGGNLPECLANLTSLQYLDLSSNQFTGNIAISPLRSLTSIQYLSLWDNHFQIPISLAPFFNHSKLKRFYGGYNEIYVETESHSLAPKFQLNFIYLSGYGYGGALPKFLYHQHDLQEVYMSHIHFRGEFPNWLLENNTGLNTLSLVNNSLSGPFQVPSFPHMNLSSLDISNNFFYGQIPADVGAYLPMLIFLGMSVNLFSDSIPSSICDMNSLEVLDFSNNHLTGGIPSCSSLSNIKQVYLSKNKLQGPLPSAFNNNSLLVLDLSHNHFTGRIPYWIGRIAYLSSLFLNNNHLKGEIPIQMCQMYYLSLIDLSHNNLSGSIPPCLNITSIWIDPPPVDAFFFNQEHIEFTTKSITYSYQGSILRYISGIDLSCNKLTGEIPHQIGNLSEILVLNLSHNSLTGPIPPTLSNLKQIESLDLSYNNLSGKIPPQLIELNYLAVFSVAQNNLSGKTPERTAQFSTFEASSYEGNPLLCGQPLPKSCTTNETSSSMPSTSIQNGDDCGFIDMDSFYVTFLVSYITVLLGIAAVLYINPYWRRAWFYMIEMCITSCYYFVEDSLPKRCCH